MTKAEIESWPPLLTEYEKGRLDGELKNVVYRPVGTRAAYVKERMDKKFLDVFNPRRLPSFLIEE